MPGSILIVISYVLLAVFVLVFALRSVRMMRQPMHLRWELAPVPHEKGKSHYGGSYLEEFEWWTRPRQTSLASELVYMFEEIVFLKSVWENNRRLWWFSFPFHFGLYLLVVAAVLVVLGGILGAAGVSIPGVLLGAVLVLTSAGYVLGGVGGLGLLFSRLTDPKLKDFTAPATLFNLVLLLAVFVTGLAASLAVGGFSARLCAFVGALLTADSSIEASGILAAHLIVTLVFLAYLPFSQMMHFVAKYFTYHKVRWDDEPSMPGSRLEKEVQGLLGQVVTWSGPHLKADGKKNWVDIATEDMKK